MRVQPTVNRRERHEIVSGRDDVWLHEAIVPGRAARAVRGHLIVAARRGLFCVKRADGNGRRRIPRGRNAGVSGKPGRRILPQVAGGDDHHDVFPAESLDRLHEWIAPR